MSLESIKSENYHKRVNLKIGLNYIKAKIETIRTNLHFEYYEQLNWVQSLNKYKYPTFIFHRSSYPKWKNLNLHLYYWPKLNLEWIQQRLNFFSFFTSFFSLPSLLFLHFGNADENNHYIFFECIFKMKSLNSS